LADLGQACTCLGKSGNLLRVDDRVWPGHWRNHDRPHGHRKHPNYGLEPIQWLSHAISQYCRGDSRGPSWRHALSDLILGSRAVICAYVPDQYRCGSHPTTSENEVQSILMRAPFKKFLASGNVFIWGCAAGVSVSLLMVFGLLLLIMINGLGYFWISDVAELTLKDGQHMMGQLAGREVIPRSVTPARPEGKGRLRVKIGNRDLYGLDFKWVNDDQIVTLTYPTDMVLLERREWGNMYGRIKAVYNGERPLAEGNDAGWIALAPLIDTTIALHQQITRIERVEIGSINADIEQVRLKIRAFEMENPSSTRQRGQIDDLKAQVAAAESRYQEKTVELEDLRKQFDEYSVLMADANGREKQIPVGQIIRALRPNEMNLLHKSWIYFTNVWSVLSTEPREANTEGGIFPAIFGTVMMVIIMSVVVVPFGVLAALYMREYAKQG